MEHPTSIAIFIAETDDKIRSCYPVMKQLRPDFSEEQFLDAVKRMRENEGYILAYTEEEGAVAACAGFRYEEMLHRGFSMYVDDLVTSEHLRSRGHGGALMEWLKLTASANSCAELHLDSGVQRFDAHRFYFREGMHIGSYHFRMKLK